MFDSGAGLNTILEETVLEILNVYEAGGIKLSDQRHPILELETWAHREECRGVAGGLSVPLIGAVVILMTFQDKTKGVQRAVPAKFKILAQKKTDWFPIIMGGMSIDSVERQFLGVVPCRGSFYLRALDVHVERLEKYSHGRPDKEVYAMQAGRVQTAFDADSKQCPWERPQERRHYLPG